MTDRSRFNADPNLALTANPIPPSDIEKQAVAELQKSLSDDDASARRLARIQQDADEVKAIRDASEIEEKSRALAKAVSRGIERRAEKPE